MGTLGQMLQASEDAKRQANHLTDEKIAESEAKRVKAKVDALSQAIAQAKIAIVEGIRARKNEFKIGSKVPEQQSGTHSLEPAYTYLRRLRDNRSLPDDAMLQPLWDKFIAWAKSEDLRIELVHHLPDTVDGEQVGGCYIFIKARPINSLY